jgi:flagellar hook protein FlgE
MDVIGNNIANVNTTAFKGARTEFADSFSETLRSSSGSNASSSGSASVQIGSGVTTSAIRNLQTQGALQKTGLPTDLSVVGNGFFMVKDPISSQLYATRAGDFSVDQNGYLTTSAGQRVQGFSDSTLATRGDIKIDLTGLPATSDPNAQMLSYAINGEGKINISLSDGTEFIRGQVLLQSFSDPEGLVKEGNNLFSGIGAAGPLGGSATPVSQPPGTNGMGKVQAGALELSNVDLANEFANLITTQRAYQATARMITTSDEILQELVNLKH